MAFAVFSRVQRPGASGTLHAGATKSTTTRAAAAAAAAAAAPPPELIVRSGSN